MVHLYLSEEGKSFGRGVNKYYIATSEFFNNSWP